MADLFGQNGRVERAMQKKCFKLLEIEDKAKG